MPTAAAACSIADPYVFVTWTNSSLGVVAALSLSALELTSFASTDGNSYRNVLAQSLMLVSGMSS